MHKFSDSILSALVCIATITTVESQALLALEVRKNSFITTELTDKVDSNSINSAVITQIDNSVEMGLRLLREGKYTQAIVQFNQALENNPNDDAILFYRGHAYFELGEYQRVINLINQLD